LRARVASLKAAQSSRELARIDHRRIENLVRRGSATQAELDERNNRLKVAEEQVKSAQAAIQETRATLGLGPNEANPLEIPEDLETSQSSVQSAVSDIAASLAQVGIRINPNDAAQSKSFREFLKPDGDLSAGERLESVVDNAPAVQVANASVERAERALDDAKLRLSYTEIRSEVAGFV
jgi:multidrug resistance efflux pump